jgi:Gram-negative bacterial TonB protein C-terminal
LNPPKAVQAVETWRFKPAEKERQPVAAQIAVEVDFHLY